MESGRVRTGRQGRVVSAHPCTRIICIQVQTQMPHTVAQCLNYVFVTDRRWYSISTNQKTGLGCVNICATSPNMTVCWFLNELAAGFSRYGEITDFFYLNAAVSLFPQTGRILFFRHLGRRTGRNVV